MPPSARRTPSPGERGAITWVTAVLLVGLATGAYLLTVWVPVWVMHYEAKVVVRDYGNQAVKNPDDAGQLERMCQKLRSLDQVKVLAEDGTPRTQPAVDVRPQDVLWERDARAGSPTLRVAFDYRRDLYYPLFDRWQEVTMRVDLTMDVALPDWGPTR